NGYVEIPPIASYIVTPELGDSAGIIGGLALARKAIRNK
ncbi:TPA: fructokinase, partial [Enterococcus faecium]|nr:fructokinase [Enterococcus faecium]